MKAKKILNFYKGKQIDSSLQINISYFIIHMLASHRAKVYLLGKKYFSQLCQYIALIARFCTSKWNCLIKLRLYLFSLFVLLFFFFYKILSCSMDKHMVETTTDAFNWLVWHCVNLLCGQKNADDILIDGLRFWQAKNVHILIGLIIRFVGTWIDFGVIYPKKRRVIYVFLYLYTKAVKQIRLHWVTLSHLPPCSPMSPCRAAA